MTNLIIEFLASFLIWFMFTGLFVLWIIDGKIKKEQVLHALIAVSLVFIISELLKALFPTLRPFSINGRHPLVFWIENDGAFPSSHTALAFALATTIWLHDRKVGWIYMVGALVIGVARVLANVHFPRDIFAGAVLGIVVSFLVEKLHVRLKA